MWTSHHYPLFIIKSSESINHLRKLCAALRKRFSIFHFLKKFNQRGVFFFFLILLSLTFQTVNTFLVKMRENLAVGVKIQRFILSRMMKSKMDDHLRNLYSLLQQGKYRRSLALNLFRRGAIIAKVFVQKRRSLISLQKRIVDYDDCDLFISCQLLMKTIVPVDLCTQTNKEMQQWHFCVWS